MIQEFVDEINKVIKRNINGIHTALPGKIVSFDADKGLATVLPLIKYIKDDGASIDYPQISGVPVLFPQSCNQNVSITFPIKENDGCLIVVAEQSIDTWMYGQETSTNLMFDLTNSICIPGLYAKANNAAKIACEENAVIVNVKETMIKVTDSKIELDAKDVVVTGNLEVKGSVISND